MTGPSRTVENYLKVIYQAQLAQTGEHDLVSMGQVAAALRVVPGTATTMVKTLAESGLVDYEPYAGVRLTGAGERLAASVLRRHRLVELFLVKVMGMSWAEVHDEAEHLEHVVSDRLIERIDDMLGRPAVDPHGDPIPAPDGLVGRAEDEDLLTCPISTPVVVTRVMDQDAEFLRFIERNQLEPGRSLVVEERDGAADHVKVRRHDDGHVTLGMRAASKVLVRAVHVLVCVLALAGAVAAQSTPAPPPSPFAILDNSFFVEEAFNQDAGIFQNILTYRRDDDGWEAVFTQELPVWSHRHQLSYAIPIVQPGDGAGIGDVAINYRFQVLDEDAGRPAFAPRFTLLIPTGDERRGRGSGAVSYQVNLPFSKGAGRLYYHWNVGVTASPGVDATQGFPTLLPVDATATLVTPHVGGSVIWAARPLFNILVESVVEFEEALGAPGATARAVVVTMSPGLRVGWNVGRTQWVAGAAFPVTRAGGETAVGALGYLSYELPLAR